jgi:phospholipid/cholesterol/gamma-HCH transport system permease protein
VGNPEIGLTAAEYFNSLRLAVEGFDVFKGFLKTGVFAVMVGLISCHQGLQTAGGPRGIGRSVTKAVVNSIVMILILDYFLTRFLLLFDR